MATEVSIEGRTSPEHNQTAEDRLNELVKVASAKEAVKDYAAAADLYSQATELQVEMNGEMAVANADLLYAYGKCLYHVAVSKSDVLGSQIPTSASAERKTEQTVKSSTDTPGDPADLPTKSALGQGGNDEGVPDQRQTQPYFQFTGDENFDDSDEEDASDAEEDGADDEDDFANAFETLDLARILFQRRLEETAPSSRGSGNDDDQGPTIQRLKERLADTHDLQAEISLEGEKFADAVSDLRAALELKQPLYPLEDPVIAECHYKLSLALEFSSVIRPERGEPQPTDNTETSIDSATRKDAEKHMELAIESCKLKISKAEQRLNSGDMDDAEKASFLKKNIDDVNDIVSDMEQRVCTLFSLILQSDFYLCLVLSFII